MTEFKARGEVKESERVGKGGLGWKEAVVSERGYVIVEEDERGWVAVAGGIGMDCLESLFLILNLGQASTPPNPATSLDKGVKFLKLFHYPIFSLEEKGRGMGD